MMKSKIGTVLGSVILACAISTAGMSSAAPNPAKPPAAKLTPAEVCAKKADKGYVYGPHSVKSRTGTKTVTNCHLAKPKKVQTCSFKNAAGKVVNGVVKSIPNPKDSTKTIKVCRKAAKPKPAPKKCRIGQTIQNGKCAKKP